MKKSFLHLTVIITGLMYSNKVSSQSYVPEWNDTQMKVKPLVPVNAYSFNLKDVQLLESAFTRAMKADETYLLAIEPDRLLSEFRVHSGLKAKAPKYGGWEDSGLAGHSLGHYLSAISMLYASGGNPEFLKRTNYIVNELDECQKARKTGYVGAIPKEDTVWAEVKAGNIRSRGFDLNGAWSPWYTVHKVIAGLLDARLYCNNDKALTIAVGIADWTNETIKDLSDAQLQKMLFCEYGGMNDALVNIYALTGNKKYLDLSYKFYDKKILDPLAARQDSLSGKHSNTQIPKAIGSIRRYELNGDKKDQTIAKFFWETVTQNHSYVTGGNSNYEYLGEPRKLNDRLTDNTTETCNTYNMLKLTRHLFALEPSASLMDYYEKALYNHILASQNHDNGMMCYFVPLRMGGRKEFSDEFNTFTCCVGSGMENHVKYNESIYYRGKDGSLYVNLFIPSVLSWKEKGISLKQEGFVPSAEAVTFTLTALKSTTLPIKIRKPVWAKTYTLMINGKAVNAQADKEGYLVLNRLWKSNDKISFAPAADLHTEAMPDNPNRQAVFYGPVLLAGILGKTEPDPVSGIPVFVTSEQNNNKWLELKDKNRLVFQTAAYTRPGNIELIPFSQVKDEFYTVYWDVFTPQTWAVQQKVYEELKRKQRELEARTVDILRVGEMQPERDHNFTGEKATTGEDHNRKWRSTEGSFMSFDMKTAPDKSNTLILTYWGMDNRGRIFDILINDKVIATEDLNKYKDSRFYDISYLIPTELTSGKQTVSVKLVPKTGNSAGPVYGCRMIRNEN